MGMYPKLKSPICAFLLTLSLMQPTSHTSFSRGLIQTLCPCLRQLWPFLHHSSGSPTHSLSPMIMLSSPSLNNSSPPSHIDTSVLFFAPLKTSEELHPLTGGENIVLLL